MTIRKKNSADQIRAEALEWLQVIKETPGVDLHHPAIYAIVLLADTGSFFGRNNQSMNDLFLQMRFEALRSSGQSFEEALATLGQSVGMSESTLARRIKKKQWMDAKDATGNFVKVSPVAPEEITALRNPLIDFLYQVAQRKSPSKKEKN